MRMGLILFDFFSVQQSDTTSNQHDERNHIFFISRNDHIIGSSQISVKSTGVKVGHFLNPVNSLCEW